MIYQVLHRLVVAPALDAIALRLFTRVERLVRRGLAARVRAATAHATTLVGAVALNALAEELERE